MDRDIVLRIVDVRYGSKRKWRRFQVMSALPHKADINARDCDVRFVPTTEVISLRALYLRMPPVGRRTRPLPALPDQKSLRSRRRSPFGAASKKNLKVGDQLSKCASTKLTSDDTGAIRLGRSISTLG